MLTIAIVIIIIIILIEYDRRADGFITPVYNYYYEAFPMPIFGLYNNCLRLATIGHPAIMHDVNKWFPNSKLLRDNWQTIRDEALFIYDNYQMKKFHEVSHLYSDISAESNKWRTFIIKWYSKELLQAKRLAPKTTALIKQIPNIRSCMFSIIEPHMTIPYHKGVHKGSLRYHLGLKIPKDRSKCFIEVMDKKYHWADGQDIIFDDLYRHCVRNDTDEIRAILFCDFDRPMIEPLNSINKIINNNATFNQWINDVNNMSEQPLSKKED